MLTPCTSSTERRPISRTTGCSASRCRSADSGVEAGGSARGFGAVPPLPEDAALARRGELGRQDALDAHLELVRQAREVGAPARHARRSRDREYFEAEADVALLAHGRFPGGGDLCRALLRRH